ncbi:SDR family oxidoreductase [Aeromicrobium sp.]|uniref:SDR family NAD(P)-dependent oxidoreductase n=1 Tax=Aeromicrobium sp. TaxID=1871063 RepID=UPI0025BB1255|nr:SDR family oxidoreductase [Aeromicrobium sp.]MCK5892595.1 SDR family oxidoreductase [Aeromicrobium sp.]
MSHVLVTGAASGMGAATARLLAAGGHRVVGIDVDADGLGRLAADGSLVEALVVDLADPAAITAAVGGREVDALVNVAGLGPDAQNARLIWSVNLLAPLRVAAAVSVRAGGSIVNVASITGELAVARHADLLEDPLREGFLDEVVAVAGEPAEAYTHSKWGLLCETERMAVRLAPQVRVNAVSPGVVETPMGERSMQFDWTRKAADRIPAGRLGRADEVARAVRFLISPDASYVVGSRLVVDGGYVARQRTRTPSAPISGAVEVG